MCTRLLCGATALLTTALSSAQARELRFDERVQAQEAIERVYYSHQIGATRPFEETLTRGVLEARVHRYLRQTAALEVFWRTAITDEMLQKELERMARGTRLPDRLLELHAALDNDPFVIKECLARAALVDRLSRNFFDFDSTLHAAARARADELHRRLSMGESEPSRDHPDRSVVELVLRETEVDGALEKGEAGSASCRDAPRRINLSRAEFQEWRARLPGTVGRVSAVEEVRDGFVIRVVLSETADRIRVARYDVAKTSWDVWWTEVEAALPEERVRSVAVVDRPVPMPWVAVDGAARTPGPSAAGASGHAVSASTCDAWNNGFLDEVPDSRGGHSAVWTGSVMLVWGGKASQAGLRTGGRYDPATDTWTTTSTAGAPSARSGHSAVWTGDLMLVWGGVGGGDTGGRYDPATDTWTATSTAGAPSARSGHSAIWTGTRMVVWGGMDTGSILLDTGGRYDPATDAWTATSTGGAPPARTRHTAVWTGSLMLVWGGYGHNSHDTGGRYDPATDTWTATSTAGAPSARGDHTAVFTGSLMLVWGGHGTSDLDTGGRYDPATDSWTATSTAGAPSARRWHTAVWTGDLMLVWGGHGASNLDTGGRYDPATDTWTATSITGAPAARRDHTAVWTDNLMLVWGGLGASDLNTGGRYDPATDTWTATSTAGAPSSRQDHTAIWTGNLMLVWGGYGGDDDIHDTGGRYDPATDAWTVTSITGAPSARRGHTAVWTGNLMLVWGGSLDDDDLHDTGGRYDPATDTWTATSTAGAPSPRRGHTAVWTGDLMLVWGGFSVSSPFNTGGRYDPATDTWTATSTVGAPTHRWQHTAVWTGDLMLVWGGLDTAFKNTGGRYDPATDTWTATSTAGAPAERASHTAVWTGSLMLVWGGNGPPLSDTGGRYDPATDTWTATSTAGAPSARLWHTAVWTGNLMLVWGGYGYGHFENTGGRYDPATDTWTATSIAGAPSARSNHTAVWTGSRMLVWGGYDYRHLRAGGQYLPGGHSDTDADNVGDACDNCASAFNPSQSDLDADGIGAACDCNDGNRLCSADCSFDLCDSLGVTVVADFSDNGAPEIATLLRDFAPESMGECEEPPPAGSAPCHSVAVNDSLSGQRLRLINFGGVHPLELLALDSTGGTSAQELGIVGLSGDSLVVELRDADSGALVRRIYFGASIDPKDIAVVNDFPGVTGPVLALLGIRRSTGGPVVQLRPAAGGAAISTVPLLAGYSVRALDFTDSFAETAAPELAVLSRRNATAETVVQLRDASSAKFVRNVDFGPIDDPDELAVINSYPGVTGPALVVLGHLSTADATVIRMKRAVDSGFIANVGTNATFPPTVLRLVPSFSGNPAAEAALLGVGAAGAVQAQIKDLARNGVIKNLFYGATHTAEAMLVVPSIGDSPAAEIGIVGRSKDSGEWRIQLKDAATGILISNVYPERE